MVNMPPGGIYIWGLNPSVGYSSINVTAMLSNNFASISPTSPASNGALVSI